MSRRAKVLLSVVSGAAAAYAGASYFAARRLARRLISAEGLRPAPARHAALLAGLRTAVPLAERVEHEGSPQSPVRLSLFFASPGDPAARPTILFLHGKGGDATEWEPDALRALRLGYNVLVPDLRGHGLSGGGVFTYGVLEREDLERAIAACAARFGVRPAALGVHGCSAGSLVALELAATHPSIRAMWIESLHSDPGVMARRYLSQATGLPEVLLALTARWAVRRATGELRRSFATSESNGGLERANPVRSAASLALPVVVVHGADDRLAPPRFARRVIEALPPGTVVWRVPGAGHCHHEDEAQRVARHDYERRWTEFFSRHLPVDRV